MPYRLWEFYTYTCGLLALLVSTRMGNSRSQDCGTSKLVQQPTLLLYVPNDSSVTSLVWGSARHKVFKRRMLQYKVLRKLLKKCLTGLPPIKIAFVGDTATQFLATAIKDQL